MKLKTILAAAGLTLFLGNSEEVLANSNMAADVFGGARHSYLVDHEGTAHGWGENGYYQLGNKESSTTVRYPEHIWFKDKSFAENVKMFSSSKSNFFTLAMMDDGTLRFWGYIFSYDGSLGGYWKDTDYSNYITIQNQDGTPFMNASMISSGDTHMAALRKDGTVWTWGQNGYGQLGNGKTDHTPYPQQVLMQDGSPLTDIAAISSGAWHTLALKKDGTVYGWGWNRNKQLGVTPQNITTNAIPILTNDQKVLSEIIGVEAGGEHSLVLTNKNQVMSWGHNGFGQLGNGSTTSQPYPALVHDENNQPIRDIKTIKTSGYSSYALTSDSEILAWGRNQFGQLGNGTLTETIRVPGYVKTADHVTLSNVYSFSAGWQHVLAILKDGALWSWGSNVGNTLGTEEANGGGVPLAKRILKQADVPLSIVVEGNTSNQEVKNAAVTLYNNKALLSWDNPDPSVQYVEVYRDGVYLGTSPSTIFIDNPIDAGASHMYTLKAIDVLGNKTDGINVELKNVQPVRMIEVKIDKNSPQPIKSSITLDALAEGGNERLYKFWVFENGIWRVLQDYSAANSATWTPLLEGTYKISVHVKDKESSKSYDDYKAFEFKIESESVLLNSFTSQVTSPRSVYSSILLSASASGGSEKLYKFFAYHNGVWTVLQDYSASSTLNWVPKVSGDHKLVVHAKDKYSQKSYDSYKTFTFKIVNAPVMQSLSTSSASPQLLGKTIQIKASAIGGTEKLYKFWVFDGSTWRVLKDYSEVASFDWKPASKGNYKISVHVKDRYSIRSYDSYKALNFTIK